ncbi:hypothetical protein HRR80_002781 [Exophiala dermatitidis]|nr:hypothetical protein HRR80_002781 [Exophiala dermatitidis]
MHLINSASGIYRSDREPNRAPGSSSGLSFRPTSAVEHKVGSLSAWVWPIDHMAFATESSLPHLPETICFWPQQINMDKEQPDSPSISNYDDDDLSMEALLKRIDDFQRREELITIERLEKEISSLRYQISCHQRSLHVTFNLLQEAFDAAVLIKTALQTCDEEEEMANADWLAFWGIHIETRSALEYRPMEWPQEWI